MEKERKSKKIVLVILLILLLALSIGFAAFTKELTIKSGATVKPDENLFKVVFSSKADSSAEGSPVLGGKAEGGSFGKDTTTISGLMANLKAPGEQATWKFYSYNAGEYEAFLNKVTVGTISCTPDAETEPDPAKVVEAAKHIHIKVSVGGTEFTETNQSIDSHSLEKGKGEEIIVTLTYGEDSPLVDGNFNVSIGDIQLLYESAD